MDNIDYHSEKMTSFSFSDQDLTGTTCSDVTELLALSFNKTPQNNGLINGRVKSSMKGVAPSMTSVTSSSSASIGEGSRLVPQRVGTMLLGTGFHLSHKHLLKNLINVSRCCLVCLWFIRSFFCNCCCCCCCCWLLIVVVVDCCCCCCWLLIVVVVVVVDCC